MHGVDYRMDDRRDIKKVIEEQMHEQVEFYYQSVHKDFDELREIYPYCYLTIPPTVEPQVASIRVIAVNKDLINLTGATEEDLLNMYSKELWVLIPGKYKNEGCFVYGGKWIDKNVIPQAQQHFYNLDPDKGYRLCVGVPESFARMNNVILENVKTADHILTAYADYMAGRSKKIILNQYSHGDLGINEYRRKKR